MAEKLTGYARVKALSGQQTGEEPEEQGKLKGYARVRALSRQAEQTSTPQTPAQTPTQTPTVQPEAAQDTGKQSAVASIRNAVQSRTQALRLDPAQAEQDLLGYSARLRELEQQPMGVSDGAVEYLAGAKTRYEAIGRALEDMLPQAQADPAQYAERYNALLRQYEEAGRNYTISAQRYNRQVGAAQQTIDAYNETLRRYRETQAALDNYTRLHKNEPAKLEAQANVLDLRADNMRSTVEGYEELHPDYSRMTPDQVGQYMQENVWSPLQQAGEMKTRAEQLREQAAVAQSRVEDMEYRDNMRSYLPLMRAEDWSTKSQADAGKMQSTGPKFGVKTDPITGTTSQILVSTGYDDIDYAIINGDADALNVWNGYNGDALDKSYLTQMTDEERSVYNYLYSTKGKKAAQEFLEQVTPRLQREQRRADEAWWRAETAQHPWATSLFSVLISPAKVISLWGQAASLLADGKIDPNASYNKFSYIPTAIRGEAAKQAEKWGESGSFLYQTGMSMLDFIYQAALTGSLVGGVWEPSGGALAQRLGRLAEPALQIMGTGAAADTVISLLDQGMDSTRAFSLGVVAGLAEIITENVSLEMLLSPDKLADGFILWMMKSKLAEASEEGVSDVINWGADALYDLISGQSESEWKRGIAELEAGGMSRREAAKQMLTQRITELGLDVLGGWLSGGVMGLGGAAVDYISPYARAAGSTVKNVVSDVQLASAITKIENGQEITLNDARKIINSPQALAFLREAEVLKGDVRNDSAGRHAVLDAVKKYAEQYAAGTSAGTAAQENLLETAQQAAPAEQANLLATGLTAEQTEDNLRANTQEVKDGQETAAPARGAETGTAAVAPATAADTAADTAGRQSADRDEGRGTGLGRFLQNWRDIRGTRSQSHRAAEITNRARSLRRQGKLTAFSGQDVGLANGSAEKAAHYLPEELWDDDIRQTVKDYADKGVKFVPMLGQIGLKDGGYARAFVSGDGKTMWVQVNHPELSWQQLTAHEELHREIKVNPALRAQIIEDLKKDPMIAKNYKKILDRYVRKYTALGVTDATEIEDEMLADYRAGFDLYTRRLGQNEFRRRARESILETERRTSANGEVTVVDGVAMATNEADKVTHDPKPFDETSVSGDASIETFPDWAKNYINNGGNAAEVIEQLRRFTEMMVANDVIYGYVPSGRYAYSDEGPLRKNDEYVRTFDMDASCPRTFQFLNYRNELRRMAGRPLTYNESIQLLELMRAYGQQIPCTYCYVENKRVLLDSNYLNWFNYRNAVLNAETDEDARTQMYSYDAKHGTLSNGATKQLSAWRSGDRSYQPTAVDVWTAMQTAKNSVFNYLDGLERSGALGRKTPKTKIVEDVCKEFGVTEKTAKDEVTDYVSTWIYDRDAQVPHQYAIQNDTDVSEVDQQALVLHRTAMSYANSASSARGVDNYMPYTDQLKNFVKDKKRIEAQGGIRKHSSNDFRIDYVQDYFLFFADLAAGKWTGHTYTKNADYVRIFGRTGDRINISVAFSEENGQIRENWQEGMAWKDAQQLRRDYYDNVGVMAMVTSNAQLSYALNADWIDMIIPFHSSGLDKAVWYDLRGWFDFTSKQHERFLNADQMKQALRENGVDVPKGAKAAEVKALYEENFHPKRVTTADGKEIVPHFLPGSYEVNGQTIPGHNNDLATYMRLCREYGVVPRFQGILVDDGNGNQVDATEHPNYMKLVKETARTETEQKPIQFNFNEYDEHLGMSPFDYAMQRMEEEARNGGYANTAEDPYGIIGEFAREYLGKNKPLTQGVDAMLTERARNHKEQLAEMQREEEQRQAAVVRESIDDGLKGKASRDITSEQDTAYLAAVNRGDMETAQRMVDEAAKRAGYTVKAYHGTRGDKFNVFDPNYSADELSLFFTSDPDTANDYANARGKRGNVIPTFINTGNFLEVDAKGASGVDIPYGSISEYSVRATNEGGTYHMEVYNHGTNKSETMSGSYDDVINRLSNVFGKRQARYLVDDSIRDGEPVRIAWDSENMEEVANSTVSYRKRPGTSNTRAIARDAYKKGYDGVIFRNVLDTVGWNGKPSDVYAVFDNTRIKSADPVTYDDDGNVIPLTERFNPQAQDIRYSRETHPSESLLFRPESLSTDAANGRTGGRTNYRTTNPRENRKVSRVRTHAFELGGLYNEVERQMAETQPEEFTYPVESERKSMARALDRLNTNFEGEVRELPTSKEWDGEDLDTAMGILHQYRQIGRETGDYSRFHEWSHIIQQKGTKGGKLIQSFAKYSRTATGVAQKAAENLREQAGKLTPAQQKRVQGHVDELLGAIDEAAEEAAREAVEGQKGLQLPTAKGESQKTKDALNIIKEIHDIFALRNSRSHGVPVENWTTETGDQLAGRIASRLRDPSSKAKTTMQTILDDLVTFAQEHALPTQEARQHRTALDRITDYLNNREAYAEAWNEAKQVLRDMYAGDAEKLEALESFLNATISYNGEDFDRTMFRAILEASDLLGMSKQDILNLAAVGTTESVIDRIADEFIRRVGTNDETLRDTVRRHITNLVVEGNVAHRLERMENEASKALDIKLQTLLRESRRTRADAANRIAQYLINDLGISGTDAAIAADHISGHYMDRLELKANQTLQRMFEAKGERIKPAQRDKLMDLIRLGGLTNTNVEDAVVDALGLNKVSRERQRQIMDTMAQFADTLDAIADDDPEGLRQLIREQAAVRNTKLDWLAEKVLDGTTNVEYLRSIAMAQLDLIAGDYVPRSVGEKISTVQTLAQLLNLRTSGRNSISNQVIDLVDSLANNVALLPDMIMGQITGQRSVGLTKSWASQAKRRGAIEGAGRNLLEIALDVAPAERNLSKYGTGGRRTWSMANSSTVGRILSQMERVLGYELNTTDEFHKGSVFGETIESLARWVDAGYMTMEEAEEFATEMALYRSFQDPTIIGSILGGLKDVLNLVGTGKTNGKTIKGLPVHDWGLGDLAVKYTQVPGALVHRALEFSPVGYLKAIYHIAQLANTKHKGESTIKQQRKAALALGRATTGTGLITLFALLVKAGLLRRGDDEKDKNAAALKASQGLSGVQLNLTAIERLFAGESTDPQSGDVLADIGFLEPLDSLMTIAALINSDPEIKDMNLYEFFSSPKTAKQTLGKSLEGIWLALEDTSAMQTMSNIYNVVRYHDEENDLPLYMQIPFEIASSAVTGFVPSPVRQLAQATDTVYRDQYRSQNLLDQTAARVANTIPGVRNLLAPKLTPLGEPRKYQSPFLNALNATINPGGISVYDTDAVRDELFRVYEETGDRKIMPERNAPYSVTISSHKYTLTPNERTQYQETRGQLTGDMIDAVLNKRWYKDLSETDKADLLNWIGNFANYVAKVELAEERGDTYVSTTYKKYYEALQSGTKLADIAKMYAD